MTDRTTNASQQSGWRFAATAAATFLPMTFVIVVVNFWIYHARERFIELHPEWIADHGAPTISRSIADPAIGEPFAFWMALCAVMLLLGCVPICRLYWLAGRSMPQTGKSTRTMVLWLGPAAFILEVSTAVGMVMLSEYRFPDHNFLHMIGSYVFFVSQAVVVLMIGIVSVRIATDPVAVAFLQDKPYVNPRLTRFRGPFAFGGVFLALAFLALFFLKDVEFSYGNELVHNIYVLSEPSLISYFLAVLATYYVELYATLRSSPYAPGRLVAASQTPD